MLTSTIYDDVKALVEEMGTRDPREILKEKGVELLPFREPTKVLGMYKVILGYDYIFYNPNLEENLTNMVLAHELGHVIYHSDYEEVLHINLFGAGAEEVEANLFAAHLLIPDENIHDYIEKGYNVGQMAMSEYVDVNLMMIKLKDLMKMKLIPKIDLNLNGDFFKKIDGRNEDNWEY
ncbi:MAG: ImmA/IrrE family metallo-endopeptidase [Ezakiella sp.]|nr:ImmA/IrrE family metallo-endopeptidase [Ezakiella sp.]